MKRENFLKLGSSAASGGEPGQQGGTVIGWNRLALQAIRTAQPGPLPSARALAVLHTCMYNAWAAYDDAARQTAHGVAVRLPRAERSAASKASAMSHAAYGALAGRFPAQQAVFGAWMAGLGLDPAAPGSPLSPAGIGRVQAASMLDFCRRGGAAGQPAGATAAAPQAVEPAPGRWCLAAQRLSEREGYGDDQDVRLFFALANALAHTAIRGGAGAAAEEIIRRFGGDACIEAGTAGQEPGRQAGAHAFEDARRHWEGRLF
jgi:hypothetical protein